MKLNNITFDNKTDWLKITDFENFFNLYEDHKNNIVYNLNSTLYMNIPKEYIQIYKCVGIMTWPLISYTIYKTTRLTWLLMKINNVKADAIFEHKQAGEDILYIPKDDVQTIIADLNSIEDN